MIHKIFHYQLLNAKSKELDQKNQNNNKKVHMNIKKEGKEKIFTSQLDGSTKSKDSLKKYGNFGNEKIYKKKPFVINERKKNVKIIKKRKVNFSSYYIFLQVFLFIFILSLTSETQSQHTIILTINKTGEHRVFFQGSIEGVYDINNPPSQIIINNFEKEVNDIQYFTEDNNVIKLIWNDIGKIFKDYFIIVKI